MVVFWRSTTTTTRAVPPNGTATPTNVLTTRDATLRALTSDTLSSTYCCSRALRSSTTETLRITANECADLSCIRSSVWRQSRQFYICVITDTGSSSTRATHGTAQD